MRNFDEFWEFLLDQAGESDSWWLDGWLERTKKEYDETSPCDECGSKIRIEKDIWSKTRNHRLESRTICNRCGQIFTTRDFRPSLKNMIKAGDIKQKDIEILKAELFK